MEYTYLGNTGVKVSRLCLGCMSYGSPQWRPWVLDRAAAAPFFQRAVEAGINFFDTADIYRRQSSSSGSDHIYLLARIAHRIARRSCKRSASQGFRRPTAYSLYSRGSRKHCGARRLWEGARLRSATPRSAAGSW